MGNLQMTEEWSEGMGRSPSAFTKSCGAMARRDPFREDRGFSIAAPKVVPPLTERATKPPLCPLRTGGDCVESPV